MRISLRGPRNQGDFQGKQNHTQYMLPSPILLVSKPQAYQKSTYYIWGSYDLNSSISNLQYLAWQALCTADNLVPVQTITSKPHITLFCFSKKTGLHQIFLIQLTTCRPLLCKCGCNSIMVTSLTNLILAFFFEGSMRKSWVRRQSNNSCLGGNRKMCFSNIFKLL